MPTNTSKLPPVRIPTVLLAVFCAGLFVSHILLQVAAGGFFLYTLYLTARRQLKITDGLIPVVLLFVISALYAFIVSGQRWSQPKDLLPHLVLLAIVPILSESGRVLGKNRNLWLEWIVYGAGLAGAAGVYNHFAGMPRTEGLFGGFFTLAALMTFTIPITLGMFLQEQTPKRWLFAGLILLQSAALWWTYTRSAFLGLILGLGVWGGQVFVDWFRKAELSAPVKRLLISLLIAIPVIAATAVFNSDNPRVNPLAPRVSENGEPLRQDFTSGRIDIIRDAVQITAKHIEENRWDRILLGNGLSSRKRLVESPYHSWESDYLQSFMNQGAAGLLLVLLAFALLIKKIKTALRIRKTLAASFAAAAIAFFVMSFLTLQLSSFNSAAIFVFIYANLSLSTHRQN